MNVEKYSYENIVRNLLEIGVTSLFLTLNIGSMSHPPTHSPASSDPKGTLELPCFGKLPGRHRQPIQAGKREIVMKPGECSTTLKNWRGRQ